MAQGQSTVTATVRWLIGTWAVHFQRAYASIAGEQPQVEWQPDGAGPGAQEGTAFLWHEQEFTLPPAGSLWIGAPEPAWQAIGGGILLAAGLESTDMAEVRSTYDEILSQSFSALAQSLTERLGREVVCGAGRAGADTPPAVEIHELHFSSGEAPPLSLFIVLSPDMIAEVEAAVSETQPAPEIAPEAYVQSAGQPAFPAMKTLELLLDVEMPVSLCFGSARITVQDALKLNTGSIIELDRSVSEPVEVIVNNCVIARGEVVVVDGYYGVRIVEIISYRERLRTGRNSLSMRLLSDEGADATNVHLERRN